MILVLGAGGQLGRDTVEAFLKADMPVQGLTHAELDAADARALRRELDRRAPELVVNCAAWTAVDAAQDHPDEALRVNAGIPKNLAAAGVPVIHFSTDYVFDGTLARPYVETDPCRPISVYGETKRLGESALLEGGGRGLILRTSWVWSERPGTKNFVQTILRAAKTLPGAKPLRVVDDQWGSPTRSGDLAEAVLKLVRQGAHLAPVRLFHAAGEGETTWCRFARAVLQAAGVDREVEAISTCEYPSRVERPARSVLDNTLLNKTFGVRLPDWQTSVSSAFLVGRGMGREAFRA